MINRPTCPLPPAPEQVAGYTVEYEHRLVYATIKVLPYRTAFGRGRAAVAGALKRVHAPLPYRLSRTHGFLGGSLPPPCGATHSRIAAAALREAGRAGSMYGTSTARQALAPALCGT